jgi:hypothetical protein
VQYRSLHTTHPKARPKPQKRADLAGPPFPKQLLRYVYGTLAFVVAPVPLDHELLLLLLLLLLLEVSRGRGVAAA